jgi:hypothetical protein
MDDDDFDNWLQYHSDDNINAFIEANEDEFEEFCFKRYEIYCQSEGRNEDDEYERYRDNKE